MAWRSCSGPPVPFTPPLPVPAVYDPILFRDYLGPHHKFYHESQHNHGCSCSCGNGDVPLQDKVTERSGDLGWSLDYATAWCYRHLVGRQPEVADAIDSIRDIHVIVTKTTPFDIFHHLDNALFGGKLRNMVFLRWKAMMSCTTGTTSGPYVAGAPRITIELNCSNLEDFDADIDDLLEALIHQMIHAYFLVCCGVQKRGDKQDGRLMDGVNFGVILLTIKDISKQCADGPLRLIFHASKRKALEGQPPSINSVWPYSRDTMRGGDSAALQTYILTHSVGPAPADGRTCCLFDNGNVTFHEIRSWQVQVYASALDMSMESKGETIWDFTKNELVEYDRRYITRPSASYIELIWDKKRVIVNRKKALAFQSQKEAIEEKGKFELRIPECEEHIFRSIYDFFHHKAYAREDGEEEIAKRRQMGRRRLPPVIVGYLGGTHVRPNMGKAGILFHIQVSRVAQKLKFEELQKYAVHRLYELETTDDEPIDALRALYLDERSDHEVSIDSGLRTWVQDFLARTDEHQLNFHPLGSSLCKNGRGISNLVKIMHMHPGGFDELRQVSRSFREDVHSASRRILSGDTDAVWDASSSSLTSPYGGGIPSFSTDSLLRPSRGLIYGGLGTSPRSLSTSSLSDHVADRITDAIGDRIESELARLPGMGIGLLPNAEHVNVFRRPHPPRLVSAGGHPLRAVRNGQVFDRLALM